MQRLFQSKIFLVFIAVLLAMTLTALYREVAATLKTKREIGRLEQQAAELEAKNKSLKDVIGYLSNPAYLDKAARENLNLQAPGEVAVALPGISDLAEAGGGGDKTAKIIPIGPSKWWAYFFTPDRLNND